VRPAWAVAYARRSPDPRKMRWLDLLALWHQEHPGARGHDQALVAAMSKDALAAAIWQARQPRT
jgi:hypothetical protein